MTRRVFDTLILVFMPFAYVCAIGWGAVKFLIPLPPPLRRTRTVVGRLEEFKDGLVKQVDFNGYSVYVLMEGDAPIALDRKCTHLECNVHWDGDTGFVCRCHNGAFDRSGNVVRKPPFQPLARLECVVVGDNVVLLDPTAGKA